MILFSNNILSLFEDVVKKLESDSTTCVELYSTVSTFKQKLTQRRDDQFYGYLTKVKLQHLLPHDADRARADFTAFLNTASHTLTNGLIFQRTTGCSPCNLCLCTMECFHSAILSRSLLSSISSKKSTWMKFMMNAEQQIPF